MAETAYEYICSVLSERRGTPAEQLREDSRFIEDIGLSSLDVVVLLSDAEDELGITVPDENILSMKTIAAQPRSSLRLSGYRRAFRNRRTARRIARRAALIPRMEAATDAFDAVR